MIQICMVVCDDCLKAQAEHSERITGRKPIIRDLLCGMWVVCRYCTFPHLQEATKIIMEFK